MGCRQLLEGPTEWRTGACEDSFALNECVWRHDALQPLSKFWSTEILLSTISPFPPSGHPVRVFTLYREGGRDSAIAHIRGAPKGGGFRAAAPRNRNFKHSDLVTP
jgi:hypothetical protein